MAPRLWNGLPPSLKHCDNLNTFKRLTKSQLFIHNKYRPLTVDLVYYNLGNYQLTIYFEADNLLDHKNVTIINPLTGDAYEVGDVIPTGTNFFEVPPAGYRLPIWDYPAQYLAPRTLKLGLGVSFWAVSWKNQGQPGSEYEQK